MMEYIRLNRGLTNYNLVPANADVWDYIQDNQSDYYTSIFQYNQEQYDQWKRTGSVAGIKHVTTNKLVFDFDDKNNLEAAKSDALTLISRLLLNGIKEDNIQVSFSGSKGFCVELHTKESFSQEEFKNTTFALASDLSSFDRVVNDAQRIIRVVGTKHPVSGLYKIPLSVKQLSDQSVTQIKMIAANLESVDQSVMLGWLPVDLPESLKKIKVTKKEEKLVVEKMEHTLDTTLKPKWLSEAKFALQQGFFEDGERNLACMILASTYKNQGFPKEITYRILKGTLELRAERLGNDGYDKKELWKTIIEPVYSPHWQGGTYSYENTPLLQIVTKRLSLSVPNVETKKTVIISDVGIKFSSFAKNFEKNRILTGIKELDEDVILTTGMAVGLLGAPSSGKTAHALNILEYASKNGIACGMGSHDMYDALLFCRLIQKYCPYDFKRITTMVKDGNFDSKLQSAWDKVMETFNNVGFNFQSSPSIEDLYMFVDEYEQNYGNKMKLLIVDYLEKLSGPYSDPTANSGYLAAKLADLAKERDLCVVVLLQPQKQAGDPSEPLLSMRNVKGASRIEQDLRVIMTTWRPGFNPENNNADDKYSSIAVVKNNMGPVGKFDFKWDGVSGRIRSLMDEERDDLKNVIDANQRRKAAKANDI